MENEGVRDSDFQHFFLTQSQCAANTAAKRIKTNISKFC